MISFVRRLPIVVWCALLATAGLLVVPPVAHAEDPKPVITTEPADLSRVQDGDQVRITVAGLPARATATAALCPDPMRDNLAIRTTTARFNAYCQPVSSESIPDLVANKVSAPRNANTQTIVLNYTVARGGIGNGLDIQEWDPVTKTDKPFHYTYRCDEQNPCALWLSFAAKFPGSTKNTTWLDNSLKIAPRPANALPPGCADPNPNSSVNVAFPERWSKSNQRWTEILCAQTGSPPPPAALALREGDVVAGFDSGQREVAFTGVGSALSKDPTRERVHVPAALNAVVLAAVGRQQVGVQDGASATPILGPITDVLKFDWPELAAILARRQENSSFNGVMRDGTPLVARNPLLSGALPQNRLTALGGMIGPDSVPLLLSSQLTAKAAKEWVFSEKPAVAGDKAGKPVGVLTDFLELSPASSANLQPAASSKVTLRSAMRPLTEGVGCSAEQSACVGFVVTDLATATEFGWQPVALPNSAGQLVAPTPAAVAAGAAHLAKAEDGTLRPGDTGADAGAYPLSFVEYATAPRNPLVGEGCVPLKEKQQSLRAYLSTLTGGGQQALGPGLVSLTPALLEQAKQAAAAVGTGTVADACAERAAAAGDPGAGTGPTPGAGTGTTAPATGNPAGHTSDNGAGTPETAKAPTAASVQEAKKLADATRIPPPLGGGVLGALIPLLALVVLVVLPSATAYLAAGRPVPPWLVRTLRRFGDALTRNGTRLAPAGGGA
ncbi:hypothetical protein [Amycolatopsis anabasis]|uniref:hypothetical protein n=1 Tax=Amycolatopsis anabasis TaxID=1840409 RepID=UPI001FE6FD10|nr:hypothetical protein [Amycolatopsis anabasis]